MSDGTTPAGLETDQRPWGSYTVLDDEPTFKVKRNRIEEVYGTMFERWSDAKRSVIWHIG